MAGLFSGVVIFTCEGINGRVHGELLMGECGPGNRSDIVMGSGWVLCW